ncbi:MAG: alpha-amylase family glycosyl hydrolase [Pyrinomonadaceae bacterium]
MTKNQKHLRSLRNALLILLMAAATAVDLCAQTDPTASLARPTRDWVRDGVVYEIYERDFSAAGTFDGITAQLDRLKELGVNVLWLMPVHPIGHVKKKGTIGSPYAVRDYYGINRDYGSKADLKRLVAEAHRRGLKVIIDIVANHTSWDSVMMSHKDWYEHNAKGQITYPHDWTDVAELNYSNLQLRRYMVDMLKYWLREFDLDGFRCDVAEEVPIGFWEQARAQLEQVKPDIVMLAEGHKPELLVKAFDFDYSWPLHSALTNVLQGRSPASELRRIWQAEEKEWPRGALHMRFSDNHDERRAIARFGESGALAASAFMLSLDGVPLLYNGMEVGDTTESGAPALFEKLPIFWPIAERRPEFPRFYKQMLALRKGSEALRRGSVEWIANSDDSRVVTFERKSGTEQILVAINFSNRPFIGSIALMSAAGFEDITPDVNPPLPPDAPARREKQFARNVTLPTLSLDGWGYRIFRKR